eukprot:scaffold6179_cov119-Isochrysis_galbana.AAC.6
MPSACFHESARLMTGIVGGGGGGGGCDSESIYNYDRQPEWCGSGVKAKDGGGKGRGRGMATGVVVGGSLVMEAAATAHGIPVAMAMGAAVKVVSVLAAATSRRGKARTGGARVRGVGGRGKGGVASPQEDSRVSCRIRPLAHPILFFSLQADI